MKLNKKQSRVRRATKLRAKLSREGATRLCVHRSAQHIYAQIISPEAGKIIASTSTLDPQLKGQFSNSSNCDAASKVGARIAELAKDAGVEQVVFDRSGFRYHGRVKALAEAAREAGLKI